MNKQFDPDVVMGGYEDRNDTDEWILATTELYITTQDDNYYRTVNLFPETASQVPTGGNVQLLAYYLLLRNVKKNSDEFGGFTR